MSTFTAYMEEIIDNDMAAQTKGKMSGQSPEQSRQSKSGMTACSGTE